MTGPRPLTDPEPIVWSSLALTLLYAGCAGAFISWWPDKGLGAVSEKRSPEARARRAVKRKQALREAQRQRVVDAAERRVVRLPDGKTGRLLSVPAHSSHVSQGAKARVILASGAIVSVPLADLTVVA